MGFDSRQCSVVLADGSEFVVPMLFIIQPCERSVGRCRSLGWHLGGSLPRKLLLRPPSAATADVIRVQIGYSGGLCGGALAYCSQLTTVEPSSILSEFSNSTNTKRLPNRKVKRAIAKREWDGLVRAIDTKSLMSLTQARCHGEIDLPCSWVEVLLSDKIKIRVVYDNGKPPAPVEALLRGVPSNPVYFQGQP